MAKRIKIIDRGWGRIQLALRRLDGYNATIGLHQPEDGRPGEGDIGNVGLGVVHEFGVTINHPGGTPYMVSWSTAGRSGGMVGGNVTFLRKGDPRAIGVTQPHKITIPERSFIRSSWDAKVRTYDRLMAKQAGRVIDGTASPGQAVGLVGEKVKSDVIKRINRGIPPPLRASTIRRKRSSKPLIDTGQLKQAIKVEVRRR